MSPTINKYSKYSDYESHGIIVQELRNLSQHYKIPVFTATQNTRGSENINVAMSNSHVGDSIRKVRYADFIYMVRQDTSKDPFDPALKSSVIPKEFKLDADQLSPELLSKRDQICSNLIPLEMKITKSKDAGKDATRYLLLCTENLRIYNDLGEYIADLPSLNSASDLLEKDVNILTNIAISSLSEDFADDEDIVKLEDPFDQE